jgi:Bacterial regulatory helix-turn-helix protein, lysR family
VSVGAHFICRSMGRRTDPAVADLHAAAVSTRSLKAFQLVARMKSFNLAASELCLSPSPVSHRVNPLEADIGV